jgi:hypothetical protein
VKKISLIFLFVTVFLCQNAFCFPELVRRGYANCITCHVSPTGGGTLTTYGRSLIPEVLTTTGTEAQSKFLYGAIDLPDWLLGGGDFRILAAQANFNGASILKLVIPMQADVEAAASVGKFTFDASGGINNDINPISRRHYVLFHATDEIGLRLGKFMPAYGINTEAHAIAIKRGIGKDQATETYNLEASLISENYDIFVTGIFGRPDKPSVGAERGVAVSTSLFFGERFKTGLSYYYGYRDIESRHLAGPFAILGFTPHIFMLVEIDYQWLSAPAGPGRTTGIVDDIRLDFEVVQGIHFYLTQEYSEIQFTNPNTFSDAYGIGAQFFPWPHVELNTTFQKQRIGGSSTPFGDFYWVMLHYYL